MLLLRLTSYLSFKKTRMGVLYYIFICCPEKSHEFNFNLSMSVFAMNTQKILSRLLFETHRHITFTACSHICDYLPSSWHPGFQMSLWCSCPRNEFQAPTLIFVFFLFCPGAESAKSFSLNDTFCFCQFPACMQLSPLSSAIHARLQSSKIWHLRQSNATFVLKQPP